MAIGVISRADTLLANRFRIDDFGSLTIQAEVMKRFLLLLCIALVAPAQAQPQVAGYTMSKAENLYWPILKRGRRGPKVRVLQGLLSARGVPTARDETFGVATEKAVIRFQRALKIKADGVVGWQTWEKLVVPLQRGSRGPIVKVFQALLSQNGPQVKQDGFYGAATEKAVRNYQRKEGEELMEVDGRAPKWVWCWLVGGMNVAD